MRAFSIRNADVSRDRAALLAFVMGSQHFEHAIEPNRRLDPSVAEEHLARLTALLDEQGGRIFIAEDADGASIGWGVVGGFTGEVFVIPQERRHAFYRSAGYSDYAIELRKYLR